MSTKKINNASAHLKVGSLEIVNDGTSKTTTQLKTLQVAMVYAQADRSSLRAAIENISLDAKITPAEKVWLQAEWDRIVADHAVIVQDAAQYSLTTAVEYTDYLAAYTALSDYITPILTVPTEDTVILQTQYNSLFDQYFLTLNAIIQIILYSQVTDEVPSYEDLIDGFDGNGASTTPSTPTLEAAPISSGVRLTVDKQSGLKYLDHYDFQASEDGSNWYALGMDGQDWKTGGQGGYTSYPGESLMHVNIPAVQLAVLGTYSSSATLITVSLGTGELSVGDAIAGSGIPSGATITEIVSNTQIRISDATTSSGTGQTLTIGDDIDGSGDNKKYMGRRLYYRARRVTVAGLTSGWSSLVYAQAGQMQPGYVAAHSLLANLLETNFLQTGFANVGFSLVIGYSGYGTVDAPIAGDHRIRLTEDEIVFEVYTGSAWSSAGAMSIGGKTMQGEFKKLFTGIGIVNPNDTVSDCLTETGFWGGEVWGMEGHLEGHEGHALVEQYPGENGYTTSHKFGSLAYYNPSSRTTNRLYLHYLYPINFDNTFAIHGWFYFKGHPTSNRTIFYSGSGTNFFALVHRSDGTLAFQTSYGIFTGRTLPINEWVYVGFSYGVTTSLDHASVRLDVNDDTYNYGLGALAHGITDATPGGITYLAMVAQSQVDGFIVDELHCSGAYAASQHEAHYESGVPWGSYGAPDEVILRAAGAAEIKPYSPMRFPKPVFFDGDFTADYVNITHNIQMGGFINGSAFWSMITRTSNYTFSADIYDLNREILLNNNSSQITLTLSRDSSDPPEYRIYVKVTNISTITHQVKDYYGGTIWNIVPGQSVLFRYYNSAWHWASSGWETIWEDWTNTSYIVNFSSCVRPPEVGDLIEGTGLNSSGISYSDTFVYGRSGHDAYAGSNLFLLDYSASQLKSSTTIDVVRFRVWHNGE